MIGGRDTRDSQCSACDGRRGGLCGAFDGADEGDLAPELRVRSLLVPAGENIRLQGDAPGALYTVTSGWALGAHTLPDGRRLVTRILLPGAMIDGEPSDLKHTIEAIDALTDVVLCVQSRAALDRLRRTHTALANRYLWLIERENLLLIERMAAVGRLSARERLAHFLVEMLVRYAHRIDISDGDTMPFPVTQGVLADALGLTPEHVNRTLKRLKADGVIDVSGRMAVVMDANRLFELAQYDGDVLALAVH